MGRVQIVLIASITVVSLTGFLLNRYRARTVVYYIIVPVMMFACGYAFAWAYEISEGSLAFIMAVVLGLIGVQGAWILTTRVPR